MSASIYRHVDPETGKVEYNNTPPQVDSKKDKVVKKPLGGLETNGHIYHTETKTDEDLVREQKEKLRREQVMKQQKEANERRDRQEKEAAEAAKKAKEAQDNEDAKNALGIKISAECHVDLPFGLGEDKKIGGTFERGNKGDQTKGDITRGIGTVSAKDKLGDKAKHSPVECTVGGQVSVNPANAAKLGKKVGIPISDETIEKVDETGKKIGETKEKIEKGIEDAQEKAKEAAKEKAEEILKDMGIMK